LDWHLIYRTAAQSVALRPNQVPEEDVLLGTDDTGVNMFMQARKPNDF
jgi:hypothetical protein